MPWLTKDNQKYRVAVIDAYLKMVQRFYWPEILPIAFDYAKSEDTWNKDKGIRLLEHIYKKNKSKKILLFLIEMLETAEIQTKIKIFNLLGNSSTKLAIQALETYQHDPIEGVRIHAKRNLQNAKEWRSISGKLILGGLFLLVGFFFFRECLRKLFIAFLKTIRRNFGI